MTTLSRKLRKQQAIADIRRLIADGYLHRDIMKQLNLPPRTYYRYLQDAYEHDLQLLRRQQNGTNILALEISLLIDRLRATFSSLDVISYSSKDYGAAKDRYRECKMQARNSNSRCAIWRTVGSAESLKAYRFIKAFQQTTFQCRESGLKMANITRN